MNKRLIFKLLNIGLLFLAIFGIYYWVWSSEANKTKEVIESKLRNFEYSNLEIKGFPLKRNIIIDNFYASSDQPYLLDQKLFIEKIEISSFAFSNDADIFLKGKIKTLDANNNETGIIEFNEEPKVSIKFYDDHSLKNFSYGDNGYRVVDADNVELYKSGAASINLNSLKIENGVDYDLKVKVRDMESFDPSKEKIVSSKNNFVADVYFSTSRGDETYEFNDILKIKNFVIEDKNFKISIIGEMSRDSEDLLPSGSLAIKINDFENFIDPMIDSIVLAVDEFYESESFQMDNSEKNKERESLKTTIKNTKKNFTIIADQHSESTKEIKVFLIKRSKGGDSYFVNDKSLLEIISMFDEEENENKSSSQIFETKT